MRRTYSDEKKARALAMYRDGVDYDEIEIEIGASRKLIRAWAREAGIPGRAPTREGNPKDVRAQAVVMYLKRVPLCQIEAKVGADRGTIRRWVKEAGHQLRPRTRLDLDKLWEVYVREGVKAAAQAVGCTTSTASYHIHNPQ